MAEQQAHGRDARSRIERMEQSGLITNAQADRLRAGLIAGAGNSMAPPDESSRRRLPWTALMAVALLVLALIVFLAWPSGDGPGVVQDVASSLNQPESVGAMNKFLSVSIAIFVLVVVPVIILAASYNSLVNKEEAVLTGWGQVESQFQRRADLVPALVETVTRYMRHERETLSDITAQRQPDLDRLAEAVDNLAARQQQLADARGDDESLIENQEALTRLFTGSAAVERDIKGLLAVVEDYPELASSDQFLELQAQLEGTENRINVARLRFNEAVGEYNSAMRRIPGNLAAGLGGFRRKAYFRAEEGSDDTGESLFE